MLNSESPGRLYSYIMLQCVICVWGWFLLSQRAKCSIYGLYIFNCSSRRSRERERGATAIINMYEYANERY